MLRNHLTTVEIPTDVIISDLGTLEKNTYFICVDDLIDGAGVQVYWINFDRKIEIVRLSSAGMRNFAELPRDTHVIRLRK